MPNTSSIVNDSISCVGYRYAGWLSAVTTGTPVYSWPASVKWTPMGESVSLPQQHPAAKPGGNSFSAFQKGVFSPCTEKNPQKNPANNPSKKTPPGPKKVS